MSRRFPLMLAGTLLLLLPARAIVAEPEKHPLIVKLKGELKDPTKPFTMIVRVQAKEGMQSKVEAAFAPAVKESRKEKGCLAYDLCQDAKDPRLFLVYERWKSLADLETHIMAPYTTKLLDGLKELLTGPPDGTVFLPAAE